MKYYILVLTTSIFLLFIYNSAQLNAETVTVPKMVAQTSQADMQTPNGTVTQDANPNGNVTDYGIVNQPRDERAAPNNPATPVFSYGAGDTTDTGGPSPSNSRINPDDSNVVKPNAASIQNNTDCDPTTGTYTDSMGRTIKCTPSGPTTVTYPGTQCSGGDFSYTQTGGQLPCVPMPTTVSTPNIQGNKQQAAPILRNTGAPPPEPIAFPPSKEVQQNQ